MPYLIVEYRHDPPISDDQLYDASVALEPCLKVRNVRKLRSYVSEDHTRGFCEFEAADAESVREAYRSAKIKFENVWTAELYGPP
jgi:hypothetical protein